MAIKHCCTSYQIGLLNWAFGVHGDIRKDELFLYFCLPFISICFHFNITLPGTTKSQEPAQAPELRVHMPNTQ